MQPSQLGSHYERLLDGLPATEIELLSAARALEIGGDVERACAVLEEAFSRHPTTNLCKTLAALHLKHGRHQRSVQFMERVVDTEPNDIPSLLMLTEAQIKAGRHAAAARTLAHAESLGASKLRVFKLERQLDPALIEEDTDPLQAPPGQHRRGGDDEAATQPVGPPAACAPGADTEGQGPTDSSIFEDSTFSNLSSLRLADGADIVETSDTPSVFDTLVDAEADGDSADRTFDHLLKDLGVPLEDDAPTDPDATGAMPEVSNEGVAQKWGLDGTAGPSDRTASIDLDEIRRHQGGVEGAAGVDESPPPSLHRDVHTDATSELDDEFAAEETEVFISEEPASSPQPPKPPSQPVAPERSGADHSQRTRQRKNSTAPGLGDDAQSQRPLPPSVGNDAQNRRRATDRLPAARATDQMPSFGGSQRREPPSAMTGFGQEAPSQPMRNPSASGGRIQRLGLIAGAVILIAALSIAAAVFAASTSVTSTVEDNLQAYRDAAAADTFEGYLEGKAHLTNAIEAQSFLGGAFDDVLVGLGVLGAAEELRQDAAAEIALLSAMIEYRYDRRNTHDSEALLERATQHHSGDPRLAVARSYQLMTQGQFDAAIDGLDSTYSTHPSFRPAGVALVLAQLDSDNLPAAAKTAKELSEWDDPDIHVHLVLAMVERRLQKSSGDARLQHILDSLSPWHISARIERSYTLRQKNQEERAEAVLEEVLGPLRESASPMQRAQAQIARGHIYLAHDGHARAEEQFRRAIKAVPTRASVYNPLIGLYLDDGRLDRALELIDDATTQAAGSPQLVLRRAELLRLTGRAEAAIETLREAKVANARARWLEGLNLLELNRPDEALEAFGAAEEIDDGFAPARAYRLSTLLATADERPTEMSDDLAQTLEAFADDPHVLRAGALASLLLARHNHSRKRRAAHLERADELLEAALDAGGNETILLYDQCRQKMLAGDGRNASITCRRAARTNARYLPGVLTTAHLEIRRGKPEASIELLEGLSEEFGKDARIDQLLALAHLHRFEIDQAEALINRWAGTAAARDRMHLLAEGELARRRHRDTAALGYFKRAHQADEADARSAIEFAHTLTRLGEHDRAEELVRAHLNDIEWGPIAWIVFGEVRRRQGRFSDARENLELAINKLDDIVAPPWRTSQAYTFLAHAWADRYDWGHRYVGRYLYRGTTRGDAEYPPLNEARASYHLARRRPDRNAAIEALEKVIEYEPFNCPALSSLLNLYEESDRDDQREQLQTHRDEHCKD